MKGHESLEGTWKCWSEEDEVNVVSTFYQFGFQIKTECGLTIEIQSNFLGNQNVGSKSLLNQKF